MTTSKGAPRAARPLLAHVGLLALMVMTAANARTVWLGFSPVLPLIQQDLHLSSGATGLVMALPVFLTAALGFISGRWADRIGPNPVIGYGLLAVAAGSLLRTWAGGLFSLLLFTVVMGAGLGAVQAGLPKLVREYFPRHVATVTGIYSVGFHLGGSLAAYLSGGLLLQLFPALRWRGTFLVWGLVAVAVWLIWIAATRRLPFVPPAGGGAAPRRAVGGAVGGAGSAGQAAQPSASARLWRHPIVWLLAGQLAAIATIFFALTAWLPTYYFDLGLSVEQAGWAAAGLLLGNSPTALLVPALSDRWQQRRPFVISAAVLLAISCAGLTWWPLAAPVTWAVLAGLAIGAIYVLCLAIPADVAPRDQVGALAGLVVTVGYAISAVGPQMMGILRERSGNMHAANLVLVGLALVLCVLTFITPETAGRPLDHWRG